jgi:hypothetical protein
MEQKIHFKYYNSRLQIGMSNIKHVYLLEPKLTQLNPEVYKGKLVYRAKGSSRRINYVQIKKGLIKKDFYVLEEVPSWVLV